MGMKKPSVFMDIFCGSVPQRLPPLRLSEEPDILGEFLFSHVFIGDFLIGVLIPLTTVNLFLLIFSLRVFTT